MGAGSLEMRKYISKESLCEGGEAAATSQGRPIPRAGWPQTGSVAGSRQALGLGTDVGLYLREKVDGIEIY